VSTIGFATYWSKVFDYFGLTESKFDEELAIRAQEDESMFADPDFVMDEPMLNRVLIDSEEKMRQIFAPKA